MKLFQKGWGLPLSVASAAVTPVCSVPRCTLAQAPPAASAGTPVIARQLGTVSSIDQNSMVLKPDKPEGAPQVTVSLAPGARVLQLSPGSTDLKTAEAAEFRDIAVGDRVLVTGAAGEATDRFTARRVILMKAVAISQQHEAEESDWQRRGAGGIVTGTDLATGQITVTSGSGKINITTTTKTIFRRYSEGSVRFADTVKGTIADVYAGDQLRVRGARGEDGATIAADEIVSGTFAHVSGTILSIDATGRSLTLRDLRTKKTMTVELAEASSVRILPKEVADRFATRSGSTHPGSPAAHSSTASKGVPGADAGSQTHAGTVAGAPSTESHGEHSDFAQLVARLPEAAPSSLHKGDAVMIVGMPKTGSNTIVAVTLLGGVEPILAANPNGEADATLSPWNLGSAPEGGS